MEKLEMEIARKRRELNRRFYEEQGKTMKEEVLRLSQSLDKLLIAYIKKQVKQ